jgi:hypothetical protein
MKLCSFPFYSKRKTIPLIKTGNPTPTHFSQQSIPLIYEIMDKKSIGFEWRMFGKETEKR